MYLVNISPNLSSTQQYEQFNVLLYYIAMKIIPLLSMFNIRIGTVPSLSLSVSLATLTAHLAHVS